MRKDKSPLTQQRSLQLLSHNSWSNWKQARAKQHPYMPLQGRRSSWTQGMCLDARHYANRNPKQPWNGSVTRTWQHLHSAWSGMAPEQPQPLTPTRAAPAQLRAVHTQVRIPTLTAQWYLGTKYCCSLALGIDEDGCLKPQTHSDRSQFHHSCSNQSQLRGHTGRIRALSSQVSKTTKHGKDTNSKYLFQCLNILMMKILLTSQQILCPY